MFLEAETGFGLDFLRNVPLNESTVFSPLSIALALSLVHAGAKGESKSEIGKVLLSGASDEQFQNHFNFISEALRKVQNGVEAKLANRVYLKDGLKVEKSYLDNVQKLYAASAENLDFKKPDSAQKINKFISDSTNGKIQNMVNSNSIKDAVTLLVNALYFKGDWLDDFERHATSKRDFETTKINKKKIEFMTEYFKDRDFAEDDKFQVLSLPYKDKSYRFVIFLPKVRHSLLQTLRNFNPKQFQALIKATKSTLLNTVIPKFKIEKEYSLKTILQSLGITKIFTDSAGLSGITPNIKISDGNHKTIIEVNEEGTVAAAATVIKGVPMSGRMETPVDFTADHPFIFALVKDNHPLFLGVYQG
ncbi:unnamed protein product [Caenorhabditis angaria]|uniref:Serpin domain-containing protein n=1 Tax=Caenorhabditis angaria TaxID=860376 RepID=A0A9P1IW81_9PELO|nr:unnamed protein product [Caenorhabditis angaria]